MHEDAGPGSCEDVVEATVVLAGGLVGQVNPGRTSPATERVSLPADGRIVRILFLTAAGIRYSVAGTG